MHNDRLWRNIICRKNNAKKDATNCVVGYGPSNIRWEQGETQNNIVGTSLSDV